MHFNREIERFCGGLCVRLLHRTCPREGNAFPPHISDPSTLRLQLYFEDDSLFPPNNDFAMLLEPFWVLEETFQANTGLGISGVETE